MSADRKLRQDSQCEMPESRRFPLGTRKWLAAGGQDVQWSLRATPRNRTRTYMPTPKLNAEIIAAAIEGFESQKRRIDNQIGELRAMLSGGKTEGTATPEAPTRKRRVSAAARRRMAEGQKKRWAAIKAESKKPKSAAAKPKRKMSAAGRRAISEATKRRWALKRAEATKAQPAGAKKAAQPKPAAKKTAKVAPAKATKKSPAKATGPATTAGTVA